MHLFVTKRKEDLAYVDSLMNICPLPPPTPNSQKHSGWPLLTFLPLLLCMTWK